MIITAALARGPHGRSRRQHPRLPRQLPLRTFIASGGLRGPVPISCFNPGQTFDGYFFSEWGNMRDRAGGFERLRFLAQEY